LSAYETPELVKRASEVGVGAYLLKPPDIHGVDRAITIAMARFADMKELRQLNSDLDAYAHIVAHDLKNPLGTIVSAAEYLTTENAPMSADELDTYLRLILQSGLRMREIVDSLLLLAEVRYSEVQMQPLDMGQIVSDVCQQVWWMCRERRVELVVPDKWPTAMGRASWVQSVWANYVINAIKYGGEPPRVELGATPQSDNAVRFWVQDNGHGITAEEQRQIFHPLVRLNPERIGGHGLGLSIAQRIIEKLGGQVGVDSEPGQGSVFYFTLPTRA
jgi:two-component system, sensor histidine kinase and response regulator